MKINQGKSKAVGFTRARVKDRLNYFFFWGGGGGKKKKKKKKMKKKNYV